MTADLPRNMSDRVRNVQPDELVRVFSNMRDIGFALDKNFY